MATCAARRGAVRVLAAAGAARRCGTPAAASAVRLMSSASATSVVAPSYASGASAAPLVGLTVGAALDAAVAAHGSGRAVVSPAQRVRWTYDEFGAQVDALAAGFLKLGLVRGDRVAIWAPNCAEWLVTQFATAKAGLVLVCINPAYRTVELEYALNKVGCAAVVMAPSFKTSNYDAMMREVVPELDSVTVGRLASAKVPSLRHVICLAPTAHAGMLRYADVVRYGSAGDVADMRTAAAALDVDDAINIQFTSGTTGSPKATILSHHNVVNNAAIVGNNLGLTADDLIVVNPPLFHCFGMGMGALNALQRGAGVLLPSPGFDAGAALASAAAESATTLYGVPTMFIQMLNHASASALRPRLRSLRSGVMAGAICPVELMRRVESEFGIRNLQICYGMTETAPVSTQTSGSGS